MPETLEPEWTVGDRARASTGGWEGRIAAIDRLKERATLEAGGMRVVVPLSELVPVGSPAPAIAEPAGRKGRRSRSSAEKASPPARPVTGRRGEYDGAAEPEPLPPAGGQRQASPRGSVIAPMPVGVATTLDLRGARVEEALELLDRYLDQASLAGMPRVTVVHGHGTGALRDAVREVLEGHPLIREWRPGDRGEGGDGASIVSL